MLKIFYFATGDIAMSALRAASKNLLKPINLINLIFNKGLAIPFIVDGEGEAEQVCLDVLLYLWIEWILGGVGMLSHEGLDLNVELTDTVGSGYVKVL